MLLRGLFFAIGITLLGMVLMAGAIVLLGMSDGLIRLCNQFLKVLAVGLGVFWAMGRGGEKGLATGAAVGTVYALAGYCLCLVLGGGAFDLGQMLGENLAKMRPIFTAIRQKTYVIAYAVAICP